MRVDPQLNTTFATDDEACMYGRAAVAALTRPLCDLDQAQGEMLREWSRRAAEASGASGADAERYALMWAGAYTSARILAGVVVHFGVLDLR